MKHFVLLALLAGFSANAGDFYRCENVGGVEEYALEFNLTSKKSAFFDNDNWTVMGLRSVESLESMPPQTVYNFQRKTRELNSPSARFNITRMTASFSTNQPRTRPLATESCKEVSKDDLMSGI